jgi:hypothetical protein
MYQNFKNLFYQFVLLLLKIFQNSKKLGEFLTIKKRMLSWIKIKVILLFTNNPNYTKFA